MEIWPSRGTNAVPIAFDPNTGLVYASTWNVPRIQKIGAPRPQALGVSSTGVIARVPPVNPGDVLGHFLAINPLTGEFVALDACTGKIVWQFQTGSSINATAITDTHHGRQYVTAASGRGGLLATRYTGGKVPTGGSMSTFALLPD